MKDFKQYVNEDWKRLSMKADDDHHNHWTKKHGMKHYSHGPNDCGYIAKGTGHTVEDAHKFMTKNGYRHVKNVKTMGDQHYRIYDKNKGTPYHEHTAEIQSSDGKKADFIHYRVSRSD